MIGFRDRFEHHLLLKLQEDAVPATRAYLETHFIGKEADFFECEPDEERKALLHRFAVAGAAVRYRALHPQQVADIVALDIALPRNMREWEERSPAALEKVIVHKLYYGHFFCHVFYQDYLSAAGEDSHEIEQEMLEILAARGAEYPAEHNVGHLYPAKPALARFYRELDPTNSLNAGIGHTSRCKNWA